MSRRVLVVFYSRSGNTRRVGNAIARRLGADVDELVDLRNRRGLLGYLHAAYDALRRRTTTLAPPRLDPAGYDLVIVGTPIWGSSVTPAVAAYLTAHRAALRAVAFFLTYGGSGRSRVFAQMESLAGRAPVATLAVLDSELAPPDADRLVSRFVAQFQQHEERSPAAA